MVGRGWLRRGRKGGGRFGDFELGEVDGWSVDAIWWFRWDLRTDLMSSVKAKVKESYGWLVGFEGRQLH